jgi:hypothetical protein
MPDIPTNIADIDNQIAVARENLRELIEQAATCSGAGGRRPRGTTHR